MFQSDVDITKGPLSPCTRAHAPLSHIYGRSSRKQKLGEDKARENGPTLRQARRWRLQRRLSLARLAVLELLGRLPPLWWGLGLREALGAA